MHTDSSTDDIRIAISGSHFATGGGGGGGGNTSGPGGGGGSFPSAGGGFGPANRGQPDKRQVTPLSLRNIYLPSHTYIIYAHRDKRQVTPLFVDKHIFTLIVSPSWFSFFFVIYIYSLRPTPYVLHLS